QLLERLPEGIVQRDLVLHVRGRLPDLAYQLSQPGGQVRQFLRAQEDEGQKQDDGDLAHPEVEHDRLFNSITPRRPAETPPVAVRVVRKSPGSDGHAAENSPIWRGGPRA